MKNVNELSINQARVTESLRTNGEIKRKIVRERKKKKDLEFAGNFANFRTQTLQKIFNYYLPHRTKHWGTRICKNI